MLAVRSRSSTLRQPAIQILPASWRCAGAEQLRRATRDMHSPFERELGAICCIDQGCRAALAALRHPPAILTQYRIATCGLAQRTSDGPRHSAWRTPSLAFGPYDMGWGYDSRWPATQLARELDDQVAQARRIRPHSGCAPPLTVSKTRGTSISAPGCALLCVRAERAVRIPGLPYRRGRRRRRAVGAGERGGAAESGCAFAFAVCGAGKRGESI